MEHLASWAGLSLSSYESAGIKKSSRTTRGNKYLKTALVRSGGVASRSKELAFNQLYYRLANKGTDPLQCRESTRSAATEASAQIKSPVVF